MSYTIDFIIQLILDAIKLRYQRKSVIVLYAIILMIAFYFVFFNKSVIPVIGEKTSTSVVVVKPIRDLTTGTSFKAVGTVEAISEARLQIEAGGRITAVNTTLGARVNAGTIIAEIENASERANLLQAEGAFDVAKAGVAQSNVGIDQANNASLTAKNQALNSIRLSYSTSNDIFYNKIKNVIAEDYISNPNVIFIESKSPFLRSENRKMEDVLTKWQDSVSKLSVDDDLAVALYDAQNNVKRIINITDILINVLNDSYLEKILAGQTVKTQISILTNTRTNLSATLATLESAEVGLSNAQNTLRQAKISGSTVSNEESLANAQIKIALGSLRSAQANYEKTLVRTPISGVVNALYLKTGDYVNPGQMAAVIANNHGLEIITAISSDDSLKLKIGDKVMIDGNATGTISEIGGAVDPTIGKVALKITLPNNSPLQNGTTVLIEFALNTKPINSKISVPLSAVKLTGAGPVLFTTASSTLVALPVVLGKVEGENILISEGADLNTIIVTDARGLNAGQIVNVTTK